MAYTSPHLTVLDTTTQAIAVAGTPQLVTFNTTFLAHKIAVTSTSRFTFNEAGNYLVTINVQMDSTAANKMLDLWIRINGSDLVNSNSKTNIVNANDEKSLTFTIPITVTAAQYVEIWVNGDSTNLNLKSFAAGTVPNRPVTPSIRMTINKLP